MKKIISILLVLVMLLSLVACGAKKTTASEATTETPEAAETTEAAESTEAAEDTAEAPTAAEGKILRGTCTTTPETVDPARGTGDNDRNMYANIYEPLVMPDPEDGSPTPHLAEGWTIENEGKTYTFTLKDNLTFSDGSQITADDVKYSADRLITMGEGYAYIFNGVIEEVVVVDDLTVQFNLAKTFGPFLSAMTKMFILNSDVVKENTKAEGMYGDNGDYGTEYLLTHSAGSGPYYMESFVVHDNYVLAQNENYWAEGVLKETSPVKIELQELVEASTTKMLLTKGEVDFVHGNQDSATIDALLKNENLKANPIISFGVDYFMMNTQKAPTDDVHIRKAISYAADYSQLGDILGGAPAADGPIPSGLFGYSKTYEGFTYDMEAAKEEIAQSQYAANLADYPVQIDYIEGNGNTGKLAYLLAASLESLGFTVVINETPWVQFCNNEAEIATSPNITNAFASASYPEAGSLLETKYASWTVGNWNQNEWLQDEKFDEMLNDALATIDDDERVAKYGEIQKYIVDEVVPSVYACADFRQPVYNTDAFDWNAFSTTDEYCFYYADFAMK